MPSIRTRVLAIAATLTAALAVGAAADAHAASYYNIVNTRVGSRSSRPFPATSSSVPPTRATRCSSGSGRTSPSLGAGQFRAIVDNRLLDCLRTDRNGPNPNVIGTARMGNCSPSDTRNTWLHKSGAATPTPGLPGRQLKNVKSGEYLGDQFCFITCGSPPLATLWDGATVESDPLQLGAAMKSKCLFAASAP